MGRKERQAREWQQHQEQAKEQAKVFCALCERETPTPTEHHLIPRSQGRRRGTKISDLPTTMLCPACHKYLHNTFSNAELAHAYHNIDALREHIGIQNFLKWLKKQPITKGIRIK